jgi:DNA-binding response OmpR family regulator
MILNLLSNAVKFTPSKGRVTVDARIEEDDLLRIDFVDTGIGIPAQYLPSVFDKFQQVEAGYRRTYGGTGLGLAIVKEFVELHGGRVWAESEVGRGSRFTLVLPVSREASEARRLGARPEAPSGAGEPDADDPGSVRARRRAPRILVGDDDPFAIKLCFQYLSPKYRVESAMTGAAVIERALESPPDLIVVSLFLPDMDGWEVLRTLKEQSALRGVPVLFLAIGSGKGKGYTLGSAEYFVKPIHRTELLACLDVLPLRVPGREGPLKILVADENATDVRLLESYLRPAGYEIRVARTGEEAIRIVREDRPDLLLLDLLLPDASGFEVVAELRGEPGPMKLPTLIVMHRILSLEEKIRLMEDVHVLSSKSEVSRQSLLHEVERLIGSTNGAATARKADSSAGRSQ